MDPDHRQWDRQFQDAWVDPFHADLPCFPVLVAPAPVAMAANDLAHVLLIQNPVDDHVASLVTVLDSTVNAGRPFRVAIITRDLVAERDVLLRIGLVEDLQIAEVDCTIEPSSCKLYSAPLLPCNDGDSWTVTLRRTHFPTQGLPPWTCHVSGDQDAHAQCAQIDFNTVAVQEALVWFDTHFTLPVFDIECQLSDHVHWRPASLPWIRAPWYACDQPFELLRVYYDGSYMPHTGGLGFAAAAFVFHDDQWQFAGAVSSATPVDPSRGSYQAELFASTSTIFAKLGAKSFTVVHVVSLYSIP